MIEKISKAFDPSFSILTIAVSGFLAVLIDQLFFDQRLGVNVIITVLALLTSFHFLARRSKQEHTIQKPLIIQALILFFATTFIYRSDLTILYLNGIAITVLFFILSEVSIKKKIHQWHIRDYIALILQPLMFIIPATKAFKSSAQGITKPSDNQTIKKIFIGVIFSLPIVLLFTFLMMLADPIFESYFGNAFSYFGDVETFILRSFMIAIVACGLIGGLSYTLLYEYKGTAAEVVRKPLSRIFGRVEITTILSLVSALFTGFTILQLRYLSGGIDTLESLNLTYAEYARRGFVEMLLIVFFTIAMLLVIEHKIVKNEDKHVPEFSFFSSFLSICNFIIIASSSMRLALYVSEFGISSLRLNIFIFNAFLAIVCGLFLVKIFIDTKHSQFIFRTFITSLLFLAVMNISNIDYRMAQYNLNRYNETGKIDAFYITQISPDAIPATIELLDSENKEVREEYAKNLYCEFLDDTQSDSFVSYNYARSQSYRLLRDNEDKILENIPDEDSRYICDSEYFIR